MCSKLYTFTSYRKFHHNHEDHEDIKIHVKLLERQSVSYGLTP